MKIAFVGKGGSGKTTMTALFIKYLLEINKKVIAVDADINVGLSEALGIDIKKDHFISKTKTTKEIRKYLKGTNKKIHSIDEFVKTTPPSSGSNIINFSKKEFFHNFASYNDKNLHFMHVGTYELSDIGTSCYHTSLSILENIITHSHLEKNEYIVVDMVAGNDSFSNTLHSQFDVLILIVEPTQEGVSMAKNFQKLAQADTSAPIFFIANKVEDKDDLLFLEKNNIKVFHSFPYLNDLKKQRRSGSLILSNEIKSNLEKLYSKLNNQIIVDDKRKLEQLYILHNRYCQLDYIKGPLGDLCSQIDYGFTYK